MLRGPVTHPWRFFRAGGFDQVRLDRGADLLHLAELDQKLWVALACPVNGLEFDTKTLQLIDTDNDGRIRAPEIIAAAKWAATAVKNPDVLLKGSAELALADIADPQLLASAKQILTNLGKPATETITVEDTTDTTRILAQTSLNGDGVIPADAAPDEATKSVITDIIACLGPEADRSGKPGISQAKAEKFFAESAAYSEWVKKSESDPSILPLGDATAKAAAAIKAVRGKVDDYFTRCRLAAFDSRAVNALNRQETDYLNVAAKDLTISASEIAGFPLARIEPGKPLPLADRVNPAWAEAIAALQPLVAGKTELTETDWAALCARFAPYEAWAAGKNGGAVVEKLGLARIREILAGNSQSVIADVIAKDKALEPVFNAIAAVDKLVRFNRDLVKLLHNFISFREFYHRQTKAIFQIGTLYLDQRSCDLCIRVEDMAKHGTLAVLSRCYLAYCDCVRRSTGEKMTIAAAFTDGDSDNLMMGRNGVFYDRRGRDWDATIVKIVDNPISIRQAFWSPYKKFVRMIEEQVAKRAAAAEAGSDAKIAAAATATATADKGAPVAPKKIDIGTVAAIGVAVGGITAALGALLQAFFGLGIWMPLGVMALLLVISGPSMLIAALKLRQRNLGPLLDANGWAVNAKARINIPFGGSLTRIAVLPPGSQRDLVDPFAEGNKSRNRLILWGTVFLLVAVVWALGYLNWVLPGNLKTPWPRPSPTAATPVKAH